MKTIQASELRLNNLIQTKHNTICVVKSIYNNDMIECGNLKDDYDDFSPDPKDMYGAPLTEEWLIRGGFVKYMKGLCERYSHDDSWYDLERHGNKFCFVIEDNENDDGRINYICHSEFVHEIQNAFCILNQTELTFKD